ncbi:S-adenosylhomocysteine hydrolase (fragment) [Photobacterium kishitanii]
MIAADRISQRIKRSRRYVFERQDFENFASYSQVGRALNQLIDKDELMKLDYGLYTKKD